MNRVLLSGIGALAIAVGGVVLLPTSASAAPVTVTFRNGTNGYTGTQDASIWNYYSKVNTNYGASQTVQLGDAGTDLLDFIIKFNGLNVLAGQYSSIISAQLDLRQTGNGHGPANVSIYKVNDANAGWTEGTGDNSTDPNGGVTWSDLAYYTSPNVNTPVPWYSNTINNSLSGFVPGTDSDSTAMDTVAVDSGLGGSQHYQWDITPSLVDQWITGGANAGLLLSVDNPPTDVWSFYTGNYPPSSSTGAQPILSITYEPKPVPEPVSGSLLLIGGGILALRRRRK